VEQASPYLGIMAFSDKLKLVVRRRAHFMCCLCQAFYVDVHHIIPEGEIGAEMGGDGAEMGVNS
jgi:hypothetical protein